MPEISVNVKQETVLRKTIIGEPDGYNDITNLTTVKSTDGDNNGFDKVNYEFDGDIKE